jgi:hypothetical protein
MVPQCNPGRESNDARLFHRFSLKNVMGITVGASPESRRIVPSDFPEEMFSGRRFGKVRLAARLWRSSQHLFDFLTHVHHIRRDRTFPDSTISPWITIS